MKTLQSSETITVIYSTNFPNETISLYQGEIKCFFEMDGITSEFIALGEIEYVWFPEPQATFTLRHDQPIGHDMGIVKLQLKDSDNLLVGDVNHLGSHWGINNNGYTTSGNLISHPFIGNGDVLHSVVFHAVNFPECYYGMIFEVEGWEITLERAEFTGKEGGSFSNDLKKAGGYSITNIGRIKKKNNSLFKIKDAVELINTFSYFLSFARGLRVPTVLLVGYDSNNRRVYEQWDSSFGQGWKTPSSWLPKQQMQQISLIFPNFVAWWNDWGVTAKTVVNMYLEANHNAFGDIAIILSSSALELISRVVLVEEKQLIKASKFDDRSFTNADRVTYLLNELSIPTSLPISDDDSIDELLKFADDNLTEKELSSETASKALLIFIKVRNDITHAKKRYDAPPEVLFEATSLGLKYLDLVLLAIFKYDGSYSNRLHMSKWEGEYEPVPWNKSKK
jgi:hypothetical protein